MCTGAVDADVHIDSDTITSLQDGETLRGDASRRDSYLVSIPCDEVDEAVLCSSEQPLYSPPLNPDLDASVRTKKRSAGLPKWLNVFPLAEEETRYGRSIAHGELQPAHTCTLTST